MLRVVSWNIDGLCDLELRERAVSACAHLAAIGADVVFLQEVVDEHIPLIKRYLTPYYRIVTRPRDCPYYTIILVKESEVSVGTVELLSYPSSRMGRDLLLAKIKFKGNEFNV